MNWTVVSEYAHGSVKDSYPDPLLGKPSERVFDMYSFESILDLIDESLEFYKINQSDILAWETLFGIVIWAIGMAFKGGHYDIDLFQIDFDLSNTGIPYYLDI